MKKFISTTGYITLLLLISIPGSSQEFRLGGSAIYNFKTKGFGIGLRGEVPVKKLNILEGVSLVPQVSYFPRFNSIEEFYAGSGIHLGVYSVRKWMFYTLVNVSYKGWINYDESDDPDAKFSNFALEGGIGITRKKCFRPFLEVRLNFIGMEPNIQLGLLYTFHCDRRGMVPCSKVPPQPFFPDDEKSRRVSPEE